MPIEKKLYLQDTQVTDAGLVHLKGFTRLQALWLDDTYITDAGDKDLQQVLPNCMIIRSGR